MRQKRLEIGWGGSLTNNAPLRIDPLVLVHMDALSRGACGSLLQLLLWQHRNCGWLTDSDDSLARLVRINRAAWRKQRLELERLRFVTPHEFRGRIVFHQRSQLELVE